MWIVKNELKGIVKFPGLGLEIPPGAESDVDAVGRERAEASAQLKLALESGYLSTVRKSVVMEEGDLEKIIAKRVEEIRESLVKEFGHGAEPKP